MSDLRSQLAAKAAQTAPANSAKPGDAEQKKSAEASFIAEEQQSGVLFDPGEGRNIMAFPYAHFLYGEGSATDVTLLFSTHEVKINGIRLVPILEAMRTQTLRKLVAVPKRYEAVNSADGSLPVVRQITIEKQEDEENGGHGGGGGRGGPPPGDPDQDGADDGPFDENGRRRKGKKKAAPPPETEPPPSSNEDDEDEFDRHNDELENTEPPDLEPK